MGEIKKLFLTLLLSIAIISPIASFAAPKSVKLTYKTFENGDELSIYVYTPSIKAPRKGFSAVVFYFGGGWNSGSYTQFKPQAEILVERGLVTILVEYRTRNSHQVTPSICIEDAKSAMRYVRANAIALNVNKDMIAASGGSAGGHLAAAVRYVEGFNSHDDNLNIDCKPNALILYNPVVDNSEKGYGYKRIKSWFPAFSPMHNIKDPVPTIFILGTKDRLIPVSCGEEYKQRCEEKGGRCDLKLYEGQDHGFFNFNKDKGARRYFDLTTDDVVEFLKSIKYIK